MTIEELLKGGQLIEIEPEKVSLVKSPANQRRFIFTKAANLDISINSDQTFDGTKLTVNGEELKDLDGFNFSLVNYGEEEMEEWGATPFSAYWTLRQSSEDGLDKVETYSLHSEVKKTMEKSEILKAIKDDLGIHLDEAGFDKMSPEKQKALTNVAVFSKAFNGQPAFREGIAFFLKEGSAEEDPPADPPKDPPTEVPKPNDDEWKAEIEASIKAINDKLDKKPDDPKPDEDAAEPVTKADIESFKKALSGIAKAAGVKNSSEQDIKKGAEVKDEWPSIPL